MSVLIIGEPEEEAIRVALAAARARPVPRFLLESVGIVEQPKRALMLKDRKPGTEEMVGEYPAQKVRLGTYRAAVSFEEQPAGLTLHLSVSSQAKGMVPHPLVMRTICEAFGFSRPLCDAIGRERATAFSPERPFRVWVEEFQPGHMAINVVELEQ